MKPNYYAVTFRMRNEAGRLTGRVYRMSYVPNFAHDASYRNASEAVDGYLKTMIGTGLFHVSSVAGAMRLDCVPTSVADMKPTRRDPENVKTSEAFAHMADSFRAAVDYGAIVVSACKIYGDAAPAFDVSRRMLGEADIIEAGSTSLISGVHRAHFPRAVKAQLRSACGRMNDCTARSRMAWREAGRSMSNWRRIRDAYAIASI